MKKQVVIIHGGDVFDSYEEYLNDLKKSEYDFEREKMKGWKDSFEEKLGKGFEVIQPEMPNWMNARYVEWKMWFDKIVPFLEKEFVLIGHSLGGIFLGKYLAENTLKDKKILAVMLLAAPYRDVNSKEKLADFTLPLSLQNIEKQCDQVFLYQSKDDPVVDFANVEKYKKALPKAELVIFKDKRHFGGVPEFPELVRHVKDIFAKL